MVRSVLLFKCKLHNCLKIINRFYRNPVHADDDFVGDARLVEAHVHYTANKLGTAV